MAHGLSLSATCGDSLFPLSVAYATSSPNRGKSVKGRAKNAEERNRNQGEVIC